MLREEHAIAREFRMIATFPLDSKSAGLHRWNVHDQFVFRPTDGDAYKIRPGFGFSYAEAFKGKFGIALTLGANTVATEQSGVTHQFNYSQPARGPILTQITFRDAPKLTTNPQAGENKLWVGYLDAKKSINLFDLPIQIGAGWKTKLSVYDLEKDANLQWTYVGAAGSLTRTRANVRIINHVPKSANGGLRYGNQRFNAQIRCTWSAPRLTAQNANEEQWQYERLMFDFSGGYKINQTYEITISGRNILNEPITGFANEPGLMRVVNRYGAAWTIGVRGRW